MAESVLDGQTSAQAQQTGVPLLTSPSHRPGAVKADATARRTGRFRPFSREIGHIRFDRFLLKVAPTGGTPAKTYAHVSYCLATYIPEEPKKGGGRKACTAVMPELKDNMAEVLCDHTAGDPMQDDVIWTYLSQDQIADELAKLGTPISTTTVRDLLQELGFSRRKAQKQITMGECPQRNEQFERIAQLRNENLGSDDPVISMDTKKKELLGNFFRPGSGWSTGAVKTYDHDFRSHSDGLVVPHGLYDLKRNVGHITLGLSHDTSQFTCESLRVWWRDYGRRAWPRAQSILLLCDCGGSNSARHHIFKDDLWRLASRIGLSLRVAHYPPYCSKYNPIEHRLFPHVTRACQGVIFRTLEIVKRFIRRTTTKTGLRVTLNVVDGEYQTGRTASAEFFDSSPVQYDDQLPAWNYVLQPQ